MFIQFFYKTTILVVKSYLNKYIWAKKEFFFKFRVVIYKNIDCDPVLINCFFIETKLGPTQAHYLLFKLLWKNPENFQKF